MGDQIILCRCEDVTREQVMRAIAAGCETIDEIQRATGAGLGLCQGRFCRQLIAEEISRIYGIPMEDVFMPNFRPPTAPVSLGELADSQQKGDRS